MRTGDNRRNWSDYEERRKVVWPLAIGLFLVCITLGLIAIWSGDGRFGWSIIPVLALTVLAWITGTDPRDW